MRGKKTETDERGGERVRRVRKQGREQKINKNFREQKETKQNVK